MDAQYLQARNGKTTSGRHPPFSACVGGKTWLIYWHHSLEAAGNSDLNSCAYYTLNDSIHCTSTSGAKAQQRMSCFLQSTASDKSISPKSDSANRKQASVEVMKDVARAIATRSCLHDSKEFARCNTMQDKRDQYQQQAESRAMQE